MSRRRAPTELESGAEPATRRAPLLEALARRLDVPREPPPLPPGRHEWANSFRPSERYFRYLKLRYLIGAALLTLVVGGVLLVSIVSLHRSDATGLALFLTLFLALPLFAWMVVGYMVIRLQFDTTWYVMTDRALRIRSGIWTIREQTVTLDNAQNIRVRRGPLQRMLGIGDVAVETASAGTTDQHGNTSPHTVVVAGVDDPVAIRDRIISRMRSARGTGLGDGGGTDTGPGESDSAESTAPVAWTPAHLAVLREIREEALALSRSRT